MRYALALALIPCALVVQAVPQDTAKRKIPCKTPENAATCYWTRGRLAVYNGNPTWRTWKIGTKRILGIYSGAGSQRLDPLDNEHPEFPANLDNVYEAGYKRRVKAKDPSPDWPDTIFADFEVCPLEPEKTGEMQAVCIESARNIFVQEGYVPRYGAGSRQ